jgi:hypothetical protein
MKTLMAVTLFVLSITFSAGSQARELTKVKKVHVESAEKTERVAKGFETYRGRAFSLNQVRGKNTSIVEVLRRHQIEMTSGEIVYPEEVEYVLVPAAVKAPKAKAPHGDDGSGTGVGRAPKDDE